ncbi:hypothetical protein B0H66DRAFT_532243 [Apodospora peruviana]|uniref:DUF7689 domain-containing protein n=1 Tax=Apodospora peruviana TaxID=516989 RepID=A0AAE0M8L7_9PEZI|nr:hypothetical protein B0H66DRAFT_532243 [Apodospora peruviana]
MANQLAQFRADVSREHAAAAADGSNFIIHDDNTLHLPCNCIAWAINIRNRDSTPPNMRQLTLRLGTFEVPGSERLRRNDVEVYALRGQPLHAHKIIDVVRETCESKMGSGYVVTHPRHMLESPLRNRPNRYKYAHFSPSANRLALLVLITSSGRTIRKDHTELTPSGRIVEKQPPKSTSGRVLKSSKEAPVKETPIKEEGRNYWAF